MHVKPSQKGFSLIELTVTLAIAGIFIILFLRYSLNSMNQDAQLRFKAAVNESLTGVRNMISRPDKCTEIFKDKTVSPAGTELVGGLLINNGLSVVLQQGTFSEYKIESIKLEDSVLSNSSFDLSITYAPVSPAGLNSYFSAASTKITKSITIVGVKEGGQVKSCGAIISEVNVMAKKKFCEKMGSMALWDSSSEKCVLNSTSFKCANGEVPHYMTSAATLSCLPIGLKINFNNMFDFQNKDCPVKNYTFYQAADGRITVGCPTAAEKSAGVALRFQ
jgi:prepilin-type N-terminal cleavage/methylation domain-containing protein